ncbi:MAG TPA: membrane protein insertion efficiency factor YidD [Acetobacteraceae bacterium]|nr:membrane protein insertion efficiency factor YidD [Acetobacteraceae bacterium]
MTRQPSPAARAGIGAVRVYQWTLRPFIGANCRFYPTCSEYAIEALRDHGALRGSGLAAWRILRCNPWTTGGYDPVPACDCRPGNPARGDETGL